MSLDAAARTHPGKVRSSNEDAWVCRPAAGLFAVIDGMGGEQAGEVAAAIAVAAVAEVPDVPELAGETVLAQALRVARDRILAEADADRGKEGMGAVGTALRFDDRGGVVAWAHVGDSRAYLVGADGVRQLTHDHLADAAPGKKRQVARDLGRRDLQGDWVETGRSRVARGDLLVLCSDGLHDMVPAEELGRELVRLRADGRPADAAATRLVGMALAAGGTDNVTVVVIRVGRFRRGAAPARPWAGVLSGLALVAVAVGLWFAYGRSGGRAELPSVVSAESLLGAPGELVVPSATHTEVRSGGVLRVTGQRITGGDWIVGVGGNADVQLDRDVLDLERDLSLELSEGGEVLVRDVRVEGGRLRLVVPKGARAILEHVRLREEGALVIEGDGLVSRRDVGVIPEESVVPSGVEPPLSAPPPAAPSPAAPAPGPAAGAPP